MIAKSLLPKVSQNIGTVVVRDFKEKGYEQYITVWKMVSTLFSTYFFVIREI